jgi:triacylglycerol lipase
MSSCTPNAHTMTNTNAIGHAAQDPANPHSRAIGDVIAMQLASITYCSLTNNVASTLKKYLPDWEVAWMPTKAVQGDWAFIAYNGVQYVVAIRGSILNFSWGAFDDWFKQDFNLLEQVDWKYTDDASAKPMISLGASEALDNLMLLVDGNGQTMLQFLQKNAFPNNKWLCVTGHSLGANLATVVGPWLRYELLKGGHKMPSIFSILTFAAPTSWNKAFADQFDANFTNTWRYYNEIDIVPYSATDIIGLGNLYGPPAPHADKISVVVDSKTITLSEAFDGIAAIITAAEIYYDSVYTRVNQKRGSVPLNTNRHVFDVNAGDPLIVQWFAEAGQQHDHNNYLKWLGAAPLDCG